jgi:hypothetical protein
MRNAAQAVSHPQIHTIHLLVILTLKTATLSPPARKEGRHLPPCVDGMISEFGLSGRTRLRPSYCSAYCKGGLVDATTDSSDPFPRKNTLL